MEELTRQRDIGREDVPLVEHAENGWGDHADLPETPRSNLLDTLRSRRAAATGEQLFELEVPGYDGCLVLRLGPLGGSTLTQLIQNAQKSKSPDREFNANCDVILRACVDVVGRREPGAELEPVDPDGTSVRVDARLAELFFIEATTGREVLRALWDKVPSPEIAIGLASAEYVEWSGEAKREASEGFVGESPAAPR